LADESPELCAKTMRASEVANRVVIKPQEVPQQVLQYAQQLHNFEVDLGRPIIKQLLDSLIYYHLKRRNEALHRGHATSKANGYQGLKYGNELMRVDGYQNLKASYETMREKAILNWKKQYKKDPTAKPLRDHLIYAWFTEIKNGDSESFRSTLHKVGIDDVDFVEGIWLVAQARATKPPVIRNINKCDFCKKRQGLCDGDGIGLCSRCIRAKMACIYTPSKVSTKNHNRCDAFKKGGDKKLCDGNRLKRCQRCINRNLECVYARSKTVFEADE
jgi:hypothetical protein